MFITYSPIPNDTALFYGVPESYVNGFSITYSATTFFIGLISIMILDTCGLKISVRLSTVANLVCIMPYYSTNSWLYQIFACLSMFNKSVKKSISAGVRKPCESL